MGFFGTAPAGTATVRAEDLQPGDVIEFLGTAHVVVEIEPYIGVHSIENGGFAFGIARAGDGWGITLEVGSRVRVYEPVAPRVDRTGAPRIKPGTFPLADCEASDGIDRSDPDVRAWLAEKDFTGR